LGRAIAMQRHSMHCDARSRAQLKCMSLLGTHRQAAVRVENVVYLPSAQAGRLRCVHRCYGCPGVRQLLDCTLDAVGHATKTALIHTCGLYPALHTPRSGMWCGVGVDVNSHREAPTTDARTNLRIYASASAPAWHSCGAQSRDWDCVCNAKARAARPISSRSDPISTAHRGHLHGSLSPRLVSGVIRVARGRVPLRYAKLSWR
jgi:hypothetical protein